MFFSRFVKVNKIEKTKDIFIITNFLTKKVFLLKEKIIEMIKKGEIQNINKKILNNLFSNSFLVENENQDEERLISYLNYIKNMNQKKLNLSLIPTYNCNLNCIYCYSLKENKSNTQLN